jgi:hypothetical protein
MGVDKTAAELAIKRIKEEIKELGITIDKKQIINDISENNSRRKIFKNAFNIIKYRGSSADELLWGGKSENCKDVLSEINAEELNRIILYLSKIFQTPDIQFVKSRLEMLTKLPLLEEKIMQLKYNEQLVNQ